MLKFVDVTKTFGDITAISGVTFDVEPGEFIFITGPSGAGKSTLLNLVLHKYLPDSGEIFLNEQNITTMKNNEIPKLRQNIGVVFQDFKVLPERTVRENIEVALAVKSVDQKEWKERVGSVLNMVGLESRSELFPNQLSGGEVQRASLARALVIGPDLILADEPTGNLDWDTAESIMGLFDKVNKLGKTVIVATHHQGIIDKMKKRTVKMRGGKIESTGTRRHREEPKKEEKPEPVVESPKMKIPEIS